jgi:hypothetical protein
MVEAGLIRVTGRPRVDPELMNPLDVGWSWYESLKSTAPQANVALKLAEIVLDRERLAQRVVELSRELASMGADNPWHTWTWVYNRDDSYDVYYNGHRVQHGVIHWTDGRGANGDPVDMRFLFDFSWGHTQVADVNIELPASMFPLTDEIDYSRVYLR